MGYLSFDASVKISKSGKYHSTKKNGISGSGGIEGYMHHIGRDLDLENGIEQNHSNENINLDLTSENESYYKDSEGWKLASNTKDMIDAVNRRIQYAIDHGARIYNGGKNDTVICRPIVIQIDEAEIEDHEDTWKNDIVEMLENEFGYDNITSLSIHRDETSVHVHAAFTPVYEDESGKCSVSQTKFFTGKNALAAQHKRMRKYLIDRGYDIEIENKPIEEQCAGYTDKEGVYHAQGLTPEELNQISTRKIQLNTDKLKLKMDRIQLESDKKDFKDNKDDWDTEVKLKRKKLRETENTALKRAQEAEQLKKDYTDKLKTLEQDFQDKINIILQNLNIMNLDEETQTMLKRSTIKLTNNRTGVTKEFNSYERLQKQIASHKDDIHSKIDRMLKNFFPELEEEEQKGQQYGE